MNSREQLIEARRRFFEIRKLISLPDLTPQDKLDILTSDALNHADSAYRQTAVSLIREVLGLCSIQTCKSFRKPGAVRCDKHAEYFKAVVKKRRAKFFEAGKCVKCGRDRGAERTGLLTCTFCSHENVESKRRSRECKKL